MARQKSGTPGDPPAAQRDWFYGSAVYRLTVLAGEVPSGLELVPPDPWPGAAALGAELLAGRYRFGGQTLAAESPPWTDPRGGERFRRELHGFDWLRHLRTLGGDAARRQARMLAADWLDRCDRWDRLVWAPEVVGSRVAAWIGLHDFFLGSADDGLRARTFDSLARQVRHLAHMIGKGHPLSGSPAIPVLRGLLIGGHCLGVGTRPITLGLELLDGLLADQMYPDGGHRERSPQVQADVLRQLVDLRGCLRAARAPVPATLTQAIERMAVALRAFRHGDGGLALFNGGQKGDPALLEAVLTHADVRGEAPGLLPDSGFARLTAGRGCLILEAGPPPPPGLDTLAHAGTLACEFSHGGDRLIVNCGAHPLGEGPWRAALAATAAHSTVTVADTNSAAIEVTGGLGRRPDRVSLDRQDAPGGQLLVASHDGYAASFGIVHRRRLWLAESGDDLRGEDSLAGKDGIGIALRLHLHPDLAVGAVEPDGSVLLRTAGGAAWRLGVDGATVTLEDSVYCGQGSQPRLCRQLVAKATTGAGETVLRWALQRRG